MYRRIISRPGRFLLAWLSWTTTASFLNNRCLAADCSERPRGTALEAWRGSASGLCHFYVGKECAHDGQARAPCTRGRGWPDLFSRPGNTWEMREKRHLMENLAEDFNLLIELDERHDALLQDLDELDRQVEAVLATWLTEREVRREAA